MGKIIGCRICGSKIIYKIKVTEEEALFIGGNFRNIWLFSLDNCNVNAEIIERGKNGVSKYFTIPTCLKCKSKKKPKSVFYQSINLDDRIIFIYIVNK